LIDDRGTAWLLEVNAFPDFQQTGDEFKDLIGGLWEGVVGVAVRGFFDLDVDTGKRDRDMILVNDMDLGRR